MDVHPLAWLVDHVPETEYSAEVARIRTRIECDILGFGEDAERYAIFGRILDRFTAFFSYPEISEAEIVLQSGARVPAGVLLLQNFESLILRVRDLPQPPDAGAETKLYRIAAFVNMGVTRNSLATFNAFLKDTRAIIDSGVYSEGTPMEWSGAGGLRSKLVRLSA